MNPASAMCPPPRKRKGKDHESGVDFRSWLRFRPRVDADAGPGRAWWLGDWSELRITGLLSALVRLLGVSLPLSLLLSLFGPFGATPDPFGAAPPFPNPACRPA